MSSNFWQTRRQTERFESGNSLTQKVSAYVNTWQERCYSEGIPDEVPAKIAAANRAPSWKSIAMAILRNDMHLRSLGFDMDESELCKALREEQKRSMDRQLNIQFTRSNN